MFNTHKKVYTAPDFAKEMHAGSIFLNHYFGGFDDHPYSVAFFKTKFLGALPCDHAFDNVLAHSDNDTRHDTAEVDFFDGAGQLISRGKFHLPISAETQSTRWPATRVS